MSGENVESRTAEEPSRAGGVLVRYRVVGGPVDVDQRLTVFDDGAVELDERHRTRDTIRLHLDAAELEGVRAALEQIPREVWGSGLPHLTLARMKRALRGTWTIFPDSGSDYELRRGRRAIHGARDDIGESILVTPLVDRLDELRVRAIRAVPR